MVGVPWPDLIPQDSLASDRSRMNPVYRLIRKAELQHRQALREAGPRAQWEGLGGPALAAGPALGSKRAKERKKQLLKLEALRGPGPTLGEAPGLEVDRVLGGRQGEEDPFGGEAAARSDGGGNRRSEASMRRTFRRVTPISEVSQPPAENMYRPSTSEREPSGNLGSGRYQYDGAAVHRYNLSFNNEFRSEFSGAWGKGKSGGTADSPASVGRDGSGIRGKRMVLESEMASDQAWMNPVFRYEQTLLFDLPYWSGFVNLVHALPARCRIRERSSVD